MTTVSLEEIKANPERYQQQPNGVWRDSTTGQFCNAAGNATMFDHASATEAVGIRQQIWQENFNAGMASSHDGRQELAIQAIGTNMTEIATEGSDTAAVKAAGEVARLGGWVERNTGSPGTIVNVLNVVDGRAASELVRMIKDEQMIDWDQE